MPGSLDLHDWTEGGRRSKPPTLRERVLAAERKRSEEGQARMASAKLKGPVERAVTRAVKQTDFRGALDRRVAAQTQKFAAENPASLTGRLMSARMAETPQSRASKLAAPGQFGAQRGSRLRTSSVKRTLGRRTGT